MSRLDLGWILTEEGWTDGEILVPVSPVPDHFKEKWECIKQGVLDSDNCPLKDNGEPDWSTIEFYTAKACFFGYSFANNKLKFGEVMGWLVRLLAEDAKHRNHSTPTRYALDIVAQAVFRVLCREIVYEKMDQERRMREQKELEDVVIPPGFRWPSDY